MYALCICGIGNTSVLCHAPHLSLSRLNFQIPLIKTGQVRGKQQSPFPVATKARSEDFVPAPFLPDKQQLLPGLPPYLQYSSEPPYDSAHRGEEQAVLPIKEKLVTPSHSNPCFNSEMHLLNRINQDRGRSTIFYLILPSSPMDKRITCS